MASSGSHIPVNLTKLVYTGPGNFVSVDLSNEVPAEFCAGMWEPRLGNDIEFNFIRLWEHKEPDQIDFTFDCIYPCRNLWVNYPGNQVPVNFYEPWVTHQGNFVPVSFECGTGGSEPEFTFFSGYIDFSDGASASFSLLETLGVRFYAGENVGDDFLTTFPISDIGDTLFYNGESLDLTVSTTQSLATVNFYSGEFATTYLATDTVLENVAFLHGESALFDLALNPPDELQPRAYTGESVTFTLRTSSVLPIVFHSGEHATVEVTDNPQPDLLFEVFEGQTAHVSLSTAANFGDISFTHGEWATVVSVENEQFWRMFAGESASLDLATDTTLPAIGYTGEAASLILDTRPSEGIGIFRAHTGERSDLLLSVLTAVLLYPNEISSRTEFFCEFDISTSFDLLNETCCPVIETHERIELRDQPAPDETYDGDKVVVQVDLAAAPRFSFDFYEGSHFVGIDPNYLGQINFYEGHVPTVGYIDFEFVDFRLCYGNFIPDGDNTFIELVSEYNDDCYADFIFVGEEANVEIENNVQFDLNMYASERMFVDLYIEPILLFRVWHGEYARISNPEFPVSFHTGETLTFDFYEDRWNFYTGESALLNITTEYDVEFLEMGCLDNEYVPIDEYGDPDLENFNPVPVELEFFRHSIKARCF